MQDPYVGDVGDLGKHGLLRRLSGLTDPDGPEPHYKIGLVWYWHFDEKHPPSNKKKMSADGRHISYLKKDRQGRQARVPGPRPRVVGSPS